jgi:molybdopterin-guanine dinucleotide biosynthesis protein
MSNKRPTIVAVSGFSSNVGKTTLVCDLLKALPEWEAIKLSRGHYRSCGKDPESCCVSDLLREQAVVRSGRAANYEVGKDTGRFWDAGATNVHWVIVDDHQVEQGVNEALSRVESRGVIIEGNSFLEYIDPDFAIMCARAEGGTIKSSARATISKCNALFLTSLNNGHEDPRRQFAEWHAKSSLAISLEHLSVFTTEELADLVQRIQRLRDMP